MTLKPHEKNLKPKLRSADHIRSSMEAILFTAAKPSQYGPKI